MIRLVLAAAALALLAGAGTVYAAHPLITDDTGTQGAGRLQLELIGEYGIDKEDGMEAKQYEIPTTPFLSFGLSDSIDLVLGLPYTTVRTEKGGVESAVRGTGDLSVEVKARLYEKDGLSLAIKPGVSLPTGDEEKGLGNGRPSPGVFFIATMEAEPWAFHFNTGYIRNEYKLPADENANHRDIWHISIATQVEVAKHLSAVANLGMERNADKASNSDPAFLLGGLIYAVSDAVDVDLGIKTGLNRVETDITVLAGITWRL